MSARKLNSGAIVLVCDMCEFAETTPLEPHSLSHVTASKRAYGFVASPTGWSWDFVDGELVHTCGECRLVGAPVRERGPFE